MLWTIVGNGGCVTEAIIWLSRIVASPKSFKFPSCPRHKYNHDTFLMSDVAKNIYNLVIFERAIKAAKDKV